MAVSSKIIIRFVIAVFSLLVVLAPSETVQAKSRNHTKTVVAIGTGIIRQNDSANAREKAISKSLVSAVNKVAVEFLPLESIVRDFQAFNEVIYGQSAKFIQGYKVLIESSSEDKYWVMVKATVSINRLKELMSSAGIVLDKKTLPKILFLISEQDLEDLVPKYWWGKDSAFAKASSASALAAVMKTKGFPVIDSSSIPQNTIVEAIYDKPYLNNHEVLDLGLRLKAQVVIVGNSAANRVPNIMGDKLKSFKGIVSARAIRTDTGAEIASTTQTAEAANPDESVGARNALSNAGSLTGEELASQIVAAWHKKGKQSSMVEIMVEGTSNLAGFVKFRRIINDTSGVKNLQIKEMKSDEATIIVEFQGNAKELADALMLKTFESVSINIYEVSQNQLRIELISG
jgi:hypothetical protein